MVEHRPTAPSSPATGAAVPAGQAESAAAAPHPHRAPAGPAGLVYPHEGPLFAIVATISLVAWLALLGGTLGGGLLSGQLGVTLVTLSLLALFGVVLYLFAQSALIAYIKGTAIKITARQLPDLHARVTACAEKLGIGKLPDCYLLNGQGGFNAFATRFLGRSFVVLFSDVIDALEDRPGAVNFYVGHELAHIHRGHLVWRPVLLPGSLLPLLGAAYHRACESTCDRYGAACCASTQDAVAAITALAAGEKRWKTLSVDEYVAQAKESGGFWMSFHELVSDDPWLVKRVARVAGFREGSGLALPSRNPLAYLFAMFVPRMMGGGGALGSMLAVVAMIGVIAAIAIPSLLRARVSANESAALGDLRAVVAAETTFGVQHGRFTSLACLAAQPACLSTPANPPALPARIAAGDVRHGYRFQLELDAEKAAEFTYVATPLTQGTTGLRSFCGDSSGRIVSSPDGGDPRNPEGTSCRKDLTPLG